MLSITKFRKIKDGKPSWLLGQHQVFLLLSGPCSITPVQGDDSPGQWLPSPGLEDAVCHRSQYLLSQDHRQSSQKRCKEHLTTEK